MTVPGTAINEINGEAKHDFSFFVHAPFKEDTDAEDGERNDASVILQARFDVDGQEHACLAFFGGDAGCAVWRNVLNRSSDEDLRWDLLLAPHHVSWTFFSEDSYKDNPEPSDSSIAVLGKRRAGATVVGSCKPIKDDGDNPPNPAARERYENAVGSSNFLVTSESPDEDEPLPLVFRMSANGPVRSGGSPSSGSRSPHIVLGGAAGKPRTYG